MRIATAALSALVLTILPTTFATADNAYFFSGNKLLADCQDPSPLFAAACDGYIIGVVDAMSGTPLYGVSACVPVGVSRKQMQDIVKAWLGDHPEARHYGAPGLVVAAISEAFPC